MSNKHSVQVLRLESVCRAYIGFIWVYKHSDTLISSSAALTRLQQAVDTTVAATPVLSGTLVQKQDADPMAVQYTTDLVPGSVAVAHLSVPYKYSLVEQSGFDQNQFPELFGHLQSPTPVVDGLPVLRLHLFAFTCGSLAVAIMCHHALMDAYATITVAGQIANCCHGFQPNKFWHSRDKVQSLISTCKPDNVYPHMEDIWERAANDKKAGRLSALGDVENRCCQLTITKQAIVRLKTLNVESDTFVLSANDLCMALLWRAWTRVLISLGSQPSGSTYTGGPVDLRPQTRSLSADPDQYLGNLFLPHPISAPKQTILNHSLTSVARLLHKHKIKASLPLFKYFVDSIEAGDPDVLAEVAMGDSPAITFSNMARLPIYDVDFALDSRKRCADDVQLRSFDAPLMAFATSDGNDGLLVNIVLPESVIQMFADDKELMTYARFVY
ncbi:hypothetical protein FB645_003075 [Coemansia sp. IMI 203386]|nr:hypothetical protein FB645_003075 [Coemansia sp. IMI 203386]